MNIKKIALGAGLLIVHYVISGFTICAILMPGYMILKIVLGV